MSDHNAVVPWQERMKQYAVAAVAEERPAGQFFSVKSGVLTFGGVPIPNNTMDVVALASLHENVYYSQRYDPDKPEGPRCFAFSFDGKEMAPHKEAAEQQNPDCRTCPMNAWGSDPKGGKGKACKNVRRVAILPGGALDSAEKVKAATVGYLRVPVTSVQNYQRFVAACAARQLPPFGVVCRIRVVPDSKTQIRVEFEGVHPITDPDVLNALIERHENERTLIDFPYTVSAEGEAAAKPSHQTPVPPPPPNAASKF